MKTITTTKVRIENLPVMRNGKPTKRMKRTVISEEVEVDRIEYEGHSVYYEKSLNNSLAYREDGSILTGDFVYGCYGTKLHKNALRVVDKKLVCHATGYDGPMGKGAGARLVRIDW